MKKLFALLLNRAFISGLLVVIGSILTAVYGKDFGVDEKLTETILTITGAISNMAGFGIALTTPTKGEKK